LKKKVKKKRKLVWTKPLIILAFSGQTDEDHEKSQAE